jgi:hypothetical protein
MFITSGRGEGKISIHFIFSRYEYNPSSNLVIMLANSYFRYNNLVMFVTSGGARYFCNIQGKLMGIIIFPIVINITPF